MFEVLFRWSVDPKAGANFRLSPDISMNNNPISNVDPNGDIPVFAIPQISFNGGFSVGLEVGFGVPGVASISATGMLGANSSWSVQGRAGGLCAGYGSNGAFAGVGYQYGGLSAGYDFGSGTASVGLGVGFGNGYATSIGFSFGNGGFGFNAGLSSTYKWGVEDILGGEVSGDPIVVGKDVEYSTEFAENYWERSFPEQDNLAGVVADGSVPNNSYEVDENGRVIKDNREAYASTVQKGKKSTVYLYKASFTSKKSLWLNMGHEYTHVNFNRKAEGVKERIQHGTIAKWQLKWAKILVTDVRYNTKRWGIYRSSYTKRYNHLLPPGGYKP